MNRCPADVQHIAEAYCLGALPSPEAAAFEDHYLACGACAAALADADEYVHAMEAAAREMREAGRTASAAR